jgi:hypothetical protein
MEVKYEALKTSSALNHKPPVWPSEKQATNTTTNLQIINPTVQITLDEGNSPELDHVDPVNPEAEEDYLELLRRYLYKRRPVYLRQRLDQYYHPHLANIEGRDADQVVMRQFNEDRKGLKLAADRKYKQLLEERKELEGATQQVPEMGYFSKPIPTSTSWQRVVKKLVEHNSRKKLRDVEDKLREIEQQQYYDDNSPILMVDQLWLWVIDESLLGNVSVRLSILTGGRDYCHFLPTPSI